MASHEDKLKLHWTRGKINPRRSSWANLSLRMQETQDGLGSSSKAIFKVERILRMMREDEQKLVDKVGCFIPFYYAKRGHIQTYINQAIAPSGVAKKAG